VIGDGVSLLFGQTFLQSAYDLAGAPQGEGYRVPEDFSPCHDGLGHKENKRASCYILCWMLRGGTIVVFASEDEHAADILGVALSAQ
jgi:hypothetical protein